MKHEYYVDFDENTNSYCVFNTKGERAYSSYANENEAQNDADKRNKGEW
ncbi:hypothetical protein Q7A53_05820 [Halobacillus rhizosphaerae]